MTAQAIDRTNLYSQPSINVFTILDNRTYISDPRDDTGARKFVYDSEPLQKAFDFDGLPYIVCEDANIAPPDKRRADAKTEKLRWTQTIIVRTAKDGSSGTRTDTGITDMRQIVNDILQTFRATTVKGELRLYNMYEVDVSVIDVDSLLINQKLLHETILEITYKTDITVST